MRGAIIVAGQQQLAIGEYGNDAESDSILRRTSAVLSDIGQCRKKIDLLANNRNEEGLS
jgi:hypothetical protein